MPLKECTKNGQKGWSWGNAACQIGAGAKKRAIKMGIAIEGPDKFKEEVAKSGLATAAEVDEVAEVMVLEGDQAFAAVFDNEAMEAVHAYVSKKEREKIPEEDFGWPEEKKYPIRDAKDVESASKLIGRAPKDKQESIKNRIIKIAKRKNLPLPKAWQ